MMKKLELKNMLLCLFLVVPLIIGTAGTVYGNAFENPGREGDTIDYVGKSMSGELTAILMPVIPGTSLPENLTPVENFKVTVTWIFIGECGKVVFALSEIDHPSDFARFDQFSEELVGTAISADFLGDDPHPCFPYDDLAGDQRLIITSAKKIKKVINYDYTGGPVHAEEVQARFPADIPNRLLPPFGYIGAQITVKLAVTDPAD
jgi:hypothetical protein